jgi:hypothetical protein
MAFIVTKISPDQLETVEFEVDTLEEAQQELTLMRKKLPEDWMAQIYEVSDWKRTLKRSKKK